MSAEDLVERIEADLRELRGRSNDSRRLSGCGTRRDERVRKAASMTIDRDLYIATFSGKENFEAEGLQVPMAWNSWAPV